MMDMRENKVVADLDQPNFIVMQSGLRPLNWVGLSSTLRQAGLHWCVGCNTCVHATLYSGRIVMMYKILSLYLTAK